MKNATRHRPSSEHVSNTQMKCRPMSNLQTTEMHKHCNFCMSRKPGKRLVDFTHFKWGLSQVLDVVWGFSTLPDWQQNLWWVWHLRFQFSTFESTYKKPPTPKISALAQLAGNIIWDITGLVRRNLNLELETNEKFSLSHSVSIKLLTPQNVGVEIRAG